MTSCKKPALLAPDLIESAVAIVRPMIEAVLASDITNRPFVVAVVSGTPSINPTRPGDDFEKQAFLVTEFGEVAAIDPRFRQMALSKAERSVRTGRATAELMPHHFFEGDTTSWGSVVLDDIVVACCGVQSYHDEMFAMWIAAAIKAQAKRAFEGRFAGQRFI